MAKQLDILALEPFYGGARKQMLETLVRCSRHRWTVLKLPPRRIERRLTTAANWFAEQLSRHWVGHLDMLFTSEALNLASLYRLTPQLAKHPSVVYFHSNQLPDPLATVRHDSDLVNIGTAMAATDVWFNSRFHLRAFLARAAALVDKHPDLAGRNPMHSITKKVQFMPPAIDTSIVGEVKSGGTFERNPRLIFVETRDADVQLLNTALGMVDGRGQKFELVTVGPVEELSEDFHRQALPEAEDVAHVKAMLRSGIVTSVKPTAASDLLVTRALIAGCRPVLPQAGAYPELLPAEAHDDCLYDLDPDSLATYLINALSADSVWTPSDSIRKTLKQFDPIPVCRAMDERFEQLVASASRER